MPTAAIYARVSSKKQTDNFSIGTQLDMMRDHLVSQGYDVIPLAETGSAFTQGLSRSKLQEGLELAKNGKIQVLMFFSPDRFTRDVADGVILRRDLRESGVTLMCFHPYPREITNDLEIMNILTDYASQKDAENRRDSSKRGLRRKVEDGYYPQSVAPYGYRVFGRKRDTRVEIEETEASVVRQIFDWYYYDDIGGTEIAKRLNEKHIPSNSLKRGINEWTNRRVNKVITNVAYTGTWYAYRTKYVHGHSVRNKNKADWIPIDIPVIIPKPFWEKVRAKVTTRHVGRKKPESEYLMSCRLECTCGKKMSGLKNYNGYKGKSSRAYHYYRCNSSNSKDGKCKNNHWIGTLVDATVWTFAYDFILDPEKLLQGLRDMREDAVGIQTERERQITTLTQEIIEQSEQLESVITQRATAKSASLQRLLDERAEKMGEAIDTLQKRIHALEKEAEDDPLTDEAIESVVDEVAELRKVYIALEQIDSEADFSAKRALIDLLDLRATLRLEENGEKWVDIHYMRGTHPRKLCTQIPLHSRPQSLLSTHCITFSRRLLW